MASLVIEVHSEFTASQLQQRSSCPATAMIVMLSHGGGLSSSFVSLHAPFMIDPSALRVLGGPGLPL